MIAITGANGHLGKATISFLLKKTDPENIVAVVRDPAKIQDLAVRGIKVRQADYNNLESLKKAFTDVETVLQISAATMGDDAQEQELNVVRAAKSQGVKHIVYTSTLSPHKNAFFQAGRTCFQTEQAIEDSGITHTFFRNSMYVETIPLFIGNAIQDGQVFYPTGDGKISFVSRTDIAEALSSMLTGTLHENKIYNITGSESYSFEDIARFLKSELGLPATFTLIPISAYKEELQKTEMPDEIVDFYISIANSIKAGEFSTVSDAMKQLLHREPKTLKKYLAEFSAMKENTSI